MDKKITINPPTEMNSPYGRVSIIKELGKGVSLIISTAALSTVVVTKEIANKFLSASAKVRGDNLNNEALGYPSSDGRIHIPLYELAEKNYIKQTVSQIRDHFNHLCHLIPSYLRERGFIAAKPIYTLADKINAEYDEWLSEIKEYSKDDIVKAASEIDKYNKLKAYFTNPDFPIEKQGVLISVPSLLDYTYEYLTNNQMEFSRENLDAMSDKWRNNISEMVREEDIIEFKKAMDSETESFVAELQTARKQYINSVNLLLKTPEGNKEFSINKIDFDELLLTDDLRSEFAAMAMPDYPEPDYYGDHNREIFNALFIKRFEADIVDNWINYAPQGGNEVSLEITGLSTSVIPSNAYDELVARSLIKEYLQNNYQQPERFYSKLVNFAEEQQQIINSITNLTASMNYAKPSQAQETETLTPSAEASENVQHDESTQKQPADAFQPTAISAEEIPSIVSKTINGEPRYIVNLDNPDQYVKIEKLGENKVTIQACIGTSVVNQMNESTLVECVKSLENPVLLSNTDFENLQSQFETETIEKENSFDNIEEFTAIDEALLEQQLLFSEIPEDVEII